MAPWWNGAVEERRSTDVPKRFEIELSERESARVTPPYNVERPGRVTWAFI